MNHYNEEGLIVVDLYVYRNLELTYHTGNLAHAS